MENLVDAFIPCTYKDFNKLEFLLPSLVRYVKELKDIYLCVPDKNTIKFPEEIAGHKIFVYSDFDILPNANIDKCKFRKNWIFQQLLKLCQNVTTTEYNLVIDSDLVLVNDFPLFKDGKPIQYIGPYQNVKCYFNFFERFSCGDFGKVYPESFTADLMLPRRKFIEEMLIRYGYNVDSFVDFTLENTLYTGDEINGYFINEQELYASYVEKYHPNVYVKEKQRIIENKKFQMSQMQLAYTKEEMQKFLETVNREKYNVVKFQAGCVNTDVRWKK